MRSAPREPGSLAEPVSAPDSTAFERRFQSFAERLTACASLCLARKRAEIHIPGRMSAISEIHQTRIIIMTPLITTLDPATASLHTTTILAREGFTCSLLTLAPGDETPRREAHQIEEHILFVIEGGATVRYGDTNTILGKDQALLIRKGEQHVIAAQPGGWTKLLRVDIPPRQIVTPQIITPGQ